MSRHRRANVVLEDTSKISCGRACVGWGVDKGEPVIHLLVRQAPGMVTRTDHMADDVKAAASLRQLGIFEKAATSKNKGDGEVMRPCAVFKGLLTMGCGR
ncbi:hypothetical protein PG996_005820 [Apiospora saccharicola]|uniref:Uncharacterized protein n=1 Tax=Apiospora saccharicola TaxID=335842 RepID=A0ABR1VNN5_9PEZI